MGLPHTGHSTGNPPSRKTKNALPLNSETKRLKTLCGTTLLAGLLAERGHSRLPLQADGITPVTRPRLLASSFSRRLQGDFHRRVCPPRTKRRLSLQTFDRLLFLFFAKYPVTRLSYHIFTVCQPYFSGFSPENTDFSVPTASTNWKTCFESHNSHTKIHLYYFCTIRTLHTLYASIKKPYIVEHCTTLHFQ